MRRVFLLRAYGDFAIAVQALAATDVIVASLHLKPLYDALISRGNISPRSIDFVDFGIKGSQLNLFTNKALFRIDTFRQLSKIKQYVQSNPGSSDFVEQSARLGLLNFFTGHSFEAIFETGEPVYAAYALPAQGLERKGDKVLVLPDARLPKRVIPSSILARMEGQVARFGSDYSNFEQLIDLIQVADYVVTSDSLPLHLAYLCRKPHFILYPDGGKQDFFTPDALASESFSTFSQFTHV
ncbi:glycosyltransferase family 9 protein [Aquirufa novilacunae]|uniref:Lipopolysaccharide heptosyltransferase family protein n=1 Tax=Aquirufa novilacunae TaxID=3139305 RepID=A0ABW8U7F0_9BACT